MHKPSHGGVRREDYRRRSVERKVHKYPKSKVDERCYPFQRGTKVPEPTGRASCHTWIPNKEYI